MTVRLTETAIGKALREAEETSKRRDLADAGQPGLRLRVTPSGAASWVLAMRDPQGAMRRFPIGAFPAIGVAEARKKAGALREAVRAGADPIAEARKLRAIGRDAKEGIGTLAALLNLYGGPVGKQASAADAAEAPRVIGPGKDLKTWPEQRRKVETVFAKLLAKPLATMQAGDFQMAADAYPSAATASAAVRYVRPILKWGAIRRYVARDVAIIDPPATVKRRDRVLSRDELARLLPALAASDAGTYARAMRFMLLTACRRDEAASARWRDLDLNAGDWRIPETKNGRPHRVPLSRQAAALVASLPRGRGDELAFAARSDEAGAKLANWDRATKAIQKATKTAGWTRHDLRRTAATLMGELGVEPHVIEAALNHAAIHSQLAATYNQARYLPAVRDALQLLADHLDGIAAGGAEVVSLNRRRRA
jgi:integrase